MERFEIPLNVILLFFFKKKESSGLGRRLSSQPHLLLQKTWVLIPVAHNHL